MFEDRHYSCLFPPCQEGRLSLRPERSLVSMLVAVSMLTSSLLAWYQCFFFTFGRAKPRGMPAPNDKFLGTRQLLDLTGILLFFPVDDDDPLRS